MKTVADIIKDLGEECDLKRTRPNRLSHVEFDKESIIWLAGLLEGEGSFRLCRKKKGDYTYPAIQVGMTDGDVIVTVANIFQRKIYRKILPSGKIHYTAYVAGTDALIIMKQVLPWMHSRRTRKIKEILEYFADRGI